MALNRQALGRIYTGGARYAIRADELHRFTDALDDSSRWIDAGGRAIAHPAFAFTLVRAVMPRLLDDPELGVDRARMVHGEQAFEYRFPLREGDEVTLEAEVVAIDDKPTGQLLRVEQRMLVAGALAVRGTAVAFIRAPTARRPAAPRETPPAPREAPERTPIAHATRAVDAALARRYAEVSGDHNPIHLDDEAARAAGLGGIILHGACTLALAISELVRATGGDPRRLRSVFARFAQPVRLPDRLDITIWSNARGGHGFEVKNLDGETVLAPATAVLSG